MILRLVCPSCSNVVALEDANVGEEFECPFCKLQGVVPESGHPVTSFQVNDEPEESNSSIPKSSTNVSTNVIGEERFPGVRTLHDLIQVAAWILSVLTVIAGFAVFLEGEFSAGIALIVEGLVFLFLGLAIAKIMLVLLAIEENTRQRQK